MFSRLSACMFRHGPARCGTPMQRFAFLAVEEEEVSTGNLPEMVCLKRPFSPVECGFYGHVTGGPRCWRGAGLVLLLATHLRGPGARGANAR